MRRSPRQAVATTARFRESTTVQGILASQPLPQGRVWCNFVPLVCPRQDLGMTNQIRRSSAVDDTLRNITLCHMLRKYTGGPFRGRGWLARLRPRLPKRHSCFSLPTEVMALARRRNPLGGAETRVDGPI